MTDIPYNYRKYIDDVTKMTQRGTISSGEQVASPSSAGSRGLANTMQFTNNPTQMQMGNTTMAESMIEIRSILNRIDGVNAPVQEDAGEQALANELSKYYQGTADGFDPEGKGNQEHEEYEDIAQAFKKGLQAGMDQVNMASFEFSTHDFDVGRDGQGEVHYQMADILKKYGVSSSINKKSEAYLIKDGKAITDPSHWNTSKSVPEDAGEKIANMAQNMTKDQFMGHADELGLTPEEAAEHYEKMQGGAHVQEDAGEDEKVVDMLRNIKQHLDNHPNMNEHPSLVALDQLADDLESGDKPADYESMQEDISDKGRIALEKAGFDPMKVKEYMAVFNDHGDTSDIDQMNMDKVGLADAMAMVLASHDVENESTTEDSGELSRLKELSGLEEDDESYGYEWECSNCGTENEFVMTPQERAQYIKDWEADNQDLVANGETGENALNNLLDDTGEESGMHYGKKCMKCGTEAANPYQPMPEAEEFNIEEDEDFEEVLGALGFPEDETELFDAEYQGRKVPLNKPMRGDTKKFKVYVKDPKTGNVKKVNFGHGGTSAKRKTMRIRKSNPKARKSFRARHNCANPGPKTKARYWSCRKW